MKQNYVKEFVNRNRHIEIVIVILEFWPARIEIPLQDDIYTHIKLVHMF